MVGRKISHYKIKEKLGAGGMGSIFLAWDLHLNRPVALKLLSSEISKDSQYIRRLQQEAIAASALSHPNIVTIYDVNCYRGTHFIAMEYLKGETLREKLKREKFTLVEVIRITRQIAAALRFAHDRGFIHRDIKPENVIITEEGRVKIIDFGIVKSISPRGYELDFKDSEISTIIQTTEGKLVGTVQYMAPEQFKGKPLDGRTDIWSLGVCLFELLTGKNPFLKKTIEETIATILNDETIVFDENIPQEIKPILQKSLQKSLQTRYQSMVEILHELEEVEFKLAPKLNNGSEKLGFAPTLKISVKDNEDTLVSSTNPPNQSFKKGVYLSGVLVVLLTVILSISVPRYYSEKEKSQEIDRKKIEAQETARKKIEAQEHIVKGREYWKNRTGENLKNALGEFNAAIELAPDSADAYIGVADTYVNMEEYLGAPTLDTIPIAQKYAEKALELNNDSSEINATLGYILTKKWDSENAWENAEAHFKKAIHLNPQNTKARHWYCLFLRIQGRYNDALTQSKTGKDNDPASTLVRVNIMLNYLAEDNLDAAEEEGEELYQLDPKFWGGRGWLGMVRLLKGIKNKDKNAIKDAINDMEIAVRNSKESHSLLANLGYAYAITKDYDKKNYEKAVNVLNDLIERQKNNTATGQSIAKVYAGLGETDKVIEYLKKDLAVKSGDLPHISWHPAFKVLRDNRESRFVDLLKQMKLSLLQNKP